MKKKELDKWLKKQKREITKMYKPVEEDPIYLINASDVCQKVEDKMLEFWIRAIWFMVGVLTVVIIGRLPEWVCGG